MEIDKFDYILAVAEECNVTRAAKKLYISQPALTKYITKLEEELGVQLFDRSVMPVHLTEAGAIYLRRMTKIRQEQESMRKELQGLNSEQKIFSLGIGSSRAKTWLPRLLPQLIERFPDINFSEYNGSESILENMLLNGSIDFAVGGFTDEREELCYKNLAEECAYLALPQRWVEEAGLNPEEATLKNPLTVDGSILHGRRIALSSMDGLFYKRIDEMFQKHNLSIKDYHMLIQDAHVALELVRKGVVGAFIIDSYSEGFDTQGNRLHDLAVCRLYGEKMPRMLKAVWSRKAMKNKQYLVETMNESIQQMIKRS